VKLRLKKFLPSICFCFCLVLTYYVYSPGLSGGFLFDDYPNLQEMGDYGGVNDWDSFSAFVFNGHSGPLGRPISLASFLLDDFTWPSEAGLFKATNLKIHLICGLLVCWMTLHLMRLMGRNEEQSTWVAVICASIWLLHPFLLSTTFYVVQRMAQLSTLFTFAGITGYLYGRLLINKNKPVPAYLWMSGSLTIGTLLAVFSKENGILLSLLAWIIEICLIQTVRLDKRWQAIFFGLPIAAVAYLLLKEFNFADNIWPNRPFNQPERLMSEARIFWEYIYYLFVPQIEGRGLFQDGYQISRSLINPPITIVAVISVLGLLAIGVLSRKKYPLIAIAILFFMGSHLIESTIFGLELYFEHRNYVGTGLLFLPLVTLLVETPKLGKTTKTSIVAALLLMLSFLTYQRATLWSNSISLEKYWALSAPDSPRAQNKLAAIYMQSGQVEKAFELAEESMRRFPESSLISANYMLIHIIYSKTDDSFFQSMEDTFARQPFDAQSIMGLRNLTNTAINHKEKKKYVPLMIRFFNRLNESALSKQYQFKKLYLYSLAQLYLSLEDYDNAFNYFSEAIEMHRSMDAAMSMVALMANAGRPIESMMLLYQTRRLMNDKARDIVFVRSRDVYIKEMDRIEEILKQEMNALGISALILDKKIKK
jgi:tetratricopeptide (TPR) repeat protein